MSSSSGQRAAQFVKLNRMQPATSGHNLVVRVLEKKVVVDRQGANGVTLRLEECLVGDDTGRMYFTARNEQCDEMQIGRTVELRNAKVTMHNNHMRLAIDRWGLLNTETTRQVSDDIPETNFSDIEYELHTSD